MEELQRGRRVDDAVAELALPRREPVADNREQRPGALAGPEGIIPEVGPGSCPERVDAPLIGELHRPLQGAVEPVVQVGKVAVPTAFLRIADMPSRSQFASGPWKLGSDETGYARGAVCVSAVPFL